MMSSFRIFPNCLATLLLFSALFCPDLRGQSTELDGNAKKSSLINSVVLNAEGMLQGDVLVYENRFFDGKFFADASNREVMQVDSIHRILFDHEQRKYIVLSRVVYEHLDLKKVTLQSDGRTIRSIESGVLLDLLNKKGFQKLNNRRVQVRFDVQKNPFEMFLDPRTVGMVMEGFGTFDQLKNQLAKLATGESLVGHRVHKNSTELSFLVGIPTEQKIEDFWDVEFCNETNMPIKWSDYSRFPSGNTDHPHVTRYRWKEMGDLQVPVYYSCSAVRDFVNLNTLQNTPGDMKSECTLHWVSLNEPIANEYFEKENLYNSNRFNEYIDPQKNKATTIIEAMKKRAGKSEFNSENSEGVEQTKTK